MKDIIQSKKIGIIGAGNMGHAVFSAFLDSGLVKPENLYACSRNEKKLQRLFANLHVQVLSTAEEIVETCDVVIIGVKPQDLYAAIEPIASSFHEGHTVMSLAAGVDLQDLKNLLPEVKSILRVLPNTAAKIRTSVVAVAGTPAAEAHMSWVSELLGSMGLVVNLEDGEELEAMMVATSSGIGFLFEFMIYWSEWLEERGIDRETARKVTAQTFSGATGLSLAQPRVSFEELQKKVTSAKGVTLAGLDSMRELEIERALRISFEKASMRNRELGKSWK